MTTVSFRWYGVCRILTNWLLGGLKKCHSHPTPPEIIWFSGDVVRKYLRYLDHPVATCYPSGCPEVHFALVRVLGAHLMSFAQHMYLTSLLPTDEWKFG